MFAMVRNGWFFHDRQREKSKIDGISVITLITDTNSTVLISAIIEKKVESINYRELDIRLISHTTFSRKHLTL